MCAPGWRIGAVLLAVFALAGCGGSSPGTATVTASTAQRGRQAAARSAQACLTHFNTSGQAAPLIALHRPIIGGYVAADETLVSQRAACGVLLFVKLIPTKGPFPMLFVARSLTSSWKMSVPPSDPLSIGTRARIPGGLPVDVSSPSTLRLAPHP